MPAFIDLDLDAVLLIGEARVELVRKRGSKVRLKVSAPESVKLAKQTKPKLTKPPR